MKISESGRWALLAVGVVTTILIVAGLLANPPVAGDQR
jgi:hypothetical protein